MDGVVHKIDQVLMPPLPGKDAPKANEDSSWRKFLGVGKKMTVEEVIERLEPYVAADEGMETEELKI